MELIEPPDGLIFSLAITSLPDMAVTIGIERGGENGRRYEWNFVWIRLKVEWSMSKRSCSLNDKLELIVMLSEGRSLWVFSSGVPLLFNKIELKLFTAFHSFRRSVVPEMKHRS